MDAARYFFNSRASTSPLDFDLDLAVREDSENPVYYVQYAHARICSLLSRLGEEGEKVPAAQDVDASLMTTPEELALMKALAQFPEEIHLAARDYDPSRINRYLVSLAGDFHRFYNSCRIKGEEPAVLSARLKLAWGCWACLRRKRCENQERAARPPAPPYMSGAGRAWIR